MYTYYLFYIIIFILVIKNSFAEENLGKIVVTPNRSLVELNKVGSSVLTINKKQIESSASTTTSGILQEFGGFSVSSKGNKGSDPSYFNRGLSKRLMEDSKGACEDWKKAAELGDKNAEELFNKYCS